MQLQSGQVAMLQQQPYANTLQFPAELLAKFASRFSSLWATRGHGDCMVRFVSCPNEDESLGAQEVCDNLSASHVICHSPVLCAGSLHFRRCFQRSENGQFLSAVVYQHGKFIVDVPHTQESVPAFEKMLRVLYFAEVDPAWRILELFEVLQLSRDFDAPHCASIVMLALKSNKATESLSPEDINACFGAAVSKFGGCHDFCKMVTTEVCKQYGSLGTKILLNDIHLERWCKFSWKVVREVLKHESLKVDNENLVACLLDHWVTNNPDMADLRSPGCKEILAEIRKDILRYGQLTPTFLGGLAHESSWAYLPPKQLLEVYALRSATFAFIMTLHEKGSLLGQKDWFRPRCYSKQHQQQQHLKLLVNVELVKTKYPEPCEIVSEPFFHEGWFIKLVFRVSPNEPSGVYIVITSAAPSSTVKHLVLHCARFGIVGQKALPSHVISHKLVTLGEEVGTANLLNISNPADFSQWLRVARASTFTLEVTSLSLV